MYNGSQFRIACPLLSLRTCPVRMAWKVPPKVYRLLKKKYIKKGLSYCIVFSSFILSLYVNENVFFRKKILRIFTDAKGN